MSPRFVAPTLLLLLAAALRVAGIGTQELWLDEALTWHSVTSADFLATVLPNNTPPLYYVILKAWVALFDDSRAALRLPSAVQGTLLVAVVMWWARVVFTRRVSLWSGLWAAVSPMAIYYSQEARTYTQLTLLLALTYVCVLKAMKDDRLAWWAGAVIAATAALYTHYFAALALVFCAALIAAAPSRASWHRAAAASAGIVVAFAPWALAALTARRSGTSGMEWIAAMWERTPPSMAIPKSLEVLMLGSHAGVFQAKLKHLAVMDFPQPLRLLGVAGLVVLGAIALWPGGDDRIGRDAARWKWAVVALIVGPLVLLWLLSWWRPLYIVGRYDQIAMPAYPLLLGFACSKLQAWRGTAGVALVAALLLVPMGWRLSLYYGTPSPDLSQRTAVVLDARARDGDVLVFTELRALPVLYELSRLGYVFGEAGCTSAAGDRRLACRAYPRETEQLKGIMTVRDPESDAPQIAADAADFADDRADAANSVWIVLGHYRVASGTLAATPASAALLRGLQEVGLAPVAADIDVGILEYRAPGT